jgi:hypothetical protein
MTYTERPAEQLPTRYVDRSSLRPGTRWGGPPEDHLRSRRNDMRASATNRREASRTEAGELVIAARHDGPAYTS